MGERLWEYIWANYMYGVLEDAQNKDTINLSNFELTVVPAQLFTIPTLRKLYLQCNKISILPNDLQPWSFLSTLTLDFNSISSLSPSINQLKNLVNLNLSYNPLKNLPKEVGQLENLEILWVNHTMLEFLPSQLGDLTNLVTFGARGNSITAIPPEFGKLTHLRWLTLEDNHLTSLPDELDNLIELKHLNINKNKFKELPTIALKITLEFLSVANNVIEFIERDKLLTLKVKHVDIRSNPVVNQLIYDWPSDLLPSCLQLDDSFTFNGEEIEENEDDWSESAASSDLDESGSIDDQWEFEEIVEAVLPYIARFTGTGI